MPKIPVREMNAVPEFDKLIGQMEEAKSSIKGWQDHLKRLEEQFIQRFSEIDPASDFEGAEAMESEAYKVKLNYKLTRSVDKEKADAILRSMGEAPEHLFNVKYDYSSTLFRTLDDVHRRAVLDSTTAKRARTSVEITKKEKDNG